MKVSAMDVAYRVTCQQAEYAGSLSPQWVNGFLLLWPPSTRKKRTSPRSLKNFTRIRQGQLYPPPGSSSARGR